MSDDTPARPDPDALLADVRESEDLAARARLKIFLGAAPGVGKTYAMLVEAQELKRAGVDVVVGIVETHGRPETAALLEGLERIPPKLIDYRGTNLAEFDLDAALARRPDLLLLDELAHTNAPGVRHLKRWQDVRDLLAAGIPVATTLNVQHVESLNDVVERLTQVRVRESVPDSILDRADEIELVDLPADDLLQRLREGKVYLPERAEKALANFFTKGNLLTLRELALRRAAERVGRQVDVFRRAQGERRAPTVRERVLVCLGDPETGPALVRAGRRLADALSADWWVLHVQSPVELRLGEAHNRAVLDVLGFAEDLGAQTSILGGHSAADEIAAFVREQRIGRVVIGRSTRPRWRRLLRGTLASAVGERVPGSDILVVSVAREEGAAESPAPETPASRAELGDWLRGIAVVAACTGLGFVMRSKFELTNIVMVYLLGVSLVAVTSGRGPSILASILSVAAFDYCFVRPMFTFAVSDTQFIVTFGVMLVVAMALSTMATRLKEQAVLARTRESRVAGLLGLSRKLAVSATPERLLEVAASSVRDLTGVDAFIVATDADGRVPRSALGGGTAMDERDHAVAQWVRDHAEPAGRGTATLPASRLTFFPLVATRGVLGVLGLAFPDDARLSPDRIRLLRAATDQIGLALERAQLADEAEGSRVQAAGERTRSALLASVSHDLRTPLAAIKGAATSLLERATAVGEDDRELLATIVAESDRLNRLVADLLDMTKLDAGVDLKRDWQNVEELVGSAIARTLRRDEARPVRVNVPPELPLVCVDELLMTQALVHLLENAQAHTPAGTPIEVEARALGDEVEIVVGDRGPGIPPGDEERIFDKFYRGTTGARRGLGGTTGSGLGLAICRAIVETHRGSIVARTRPGGGAEFRIRLPRGGEAPAAIEPEEEASA